jgi:hypothetical protein
MSESTFEEDGSFIGQYGTIRKHPSFTLPSSTVTNERPPPQQQRITAKGTSAASNPGTFV